MLNEAPPTRLQAPPLPHILFFIRVQHVFGMFYPECTFLNALPSIQSDTQLSYLSLSLSLEHVSNGVTE